MVTGKGKQNNQFNLQDLTIRPAIQTDLPAITEIFNHAIKHTTASFYAEPRTIQQRTSWLDQRTSRYAVISAVWQPAEAAAQQVVGWASLEPWTEKHGYRITSEISYYVDPNYQEQGIGGRLLERLIEVAKENDFKNLLAKICEDNVGSLKLADRLQFEKVGTLKSIGEKFDRSYDVHYFQRRL